MAEELDYMTYFLNDPTLKNLYEAPNRLALPVGSVVHVQKSKGWLVNGKWYSTTPGYAAPDKIEHLIRVCELFKGFELRVQAPLSVKEWQRGWVDQYYPLSDNPVFRCVVPGMVRVELALINSDLANKTMYTYTGIPVCPTCTLEQYENESTRKIFDKAMWYFIYFWLYGRSYTLEGGE